MGFFPWQAVNHSSSAHRRFFDALQAAHGEAQGKAERRRPATGRNARWFGLHLMQGGGIEAAAKTLIELGDAERPQALSLCGKLG